MEFMDNMDFDFKTHNHGRMNFLAGFCKKLRISEIMDNYLGETNGRKPDISYGTLASMMLINICDEHSPLYLMQEYFEEHDKDLEGIFKEEIDTKKLNDDRFAYFLDRLYEHQFTSLVKQSFSPASSY